MLRILARKRKLERQLLHIASAYKAKRQFNEAIAHLEKALAINPRNNNAKIMMSRIEVLSKL